LARPAFLDGLAGAAKSQGVVRNIVGDSGPSRHISASADAHRRNQRSVTADKGAVFNYGYMLFCAVVVAGNGSRAHVDLLAHLGIAEVSQVVGLGAAAEAGLF